MTPRSLGFGVIEGFYGSPWSHRARLGMVRTLADLRLDTYLYAPKNDPHHRASWWKPIDHDERERLRELLALADSLGVSLVYSLAPERILGGKGNVRARSFWRRDVAHDGLADEPFHSLTDRIATLVELGAKRFALSFDDTWATFLPAFATFERGLLHGRVAHRALAFALSCDPHAEMFLVPAIYHRRIEDMPRGALAYLRGLGALGAEIPMAWTGPNIFSRRIDPLDVTRLSRATGLPIWIWNNAITNDWLPLATGESIGLRPTQKLSFGPAENLAMGLASVTRGVLLNAAREPELTKIPLACLAEQAREGHAYDARAAHVRAIERVFGHDAAPFAHTLYDLTKAHTLSLPSRLEGARLHDQVRDFLAGRGGLEALKTSIAELQALDAKLGALVGGSALFDEIAPTLKRISLVGEAARLAIERAVASSEGDADLARTLGRALDALTSESKKIGWEAGLDALIRLIETPPLRIARRF